MNLSNFKKISIPTRRRNESSFWMLNNYFVRKERKKFKLNNKDILG